MTDMVVGDQVADDWAGFLVLVVAPSAYMTPVIEAVRDVEPTIYSDPVLVDMARVATPDTPDPLGGDLDDVASALHRELVAWARSPARNPAPRFTFCVLVVHDDVEEASRLVSSLAATNVLSELPIIFRIGDLTLAMTADGDGSTAEQSAVIVRMIQDAIDATAHEVDRTPTFCLTKAQLALVAGRRPQPVREPRRDMPEIPLVPSPKLVPPTTSLPEHVAPTPHEGATAQPTPDYFVPSRSTPPAPVPAEPGPPNRTTVDDRADVTDVADVPAAHADRAVRARLRSTGQAIFGRLKVRRRRPALPASNVDMIDELSGRADRVSILYVVFVSGPARPAHRQRMLRAEVAVSLGRTLLTNPAPEGGPWYVKAFTADRELRPGSPLPEPELLDHKRFPDQWGEHFDLYDIVGELTESIERDTSSFLRRGVRLSQAVVVFLGSVPQTNGDDQAERLVRLGTLAETIWVSFDRHVLVPAKLAVTGVHFLRHHEDIDDELLRLVDRGSAAEPSPADITRS